MSDASGKGRRGNNDAAVGAVRYAIISFLLTMTYLFHISNENKDCAIDLISELPSLNG